MSIKMQPNKEVYPNNENGTRRSVWMPEDLDLMVEKARNKLGYNRSAFYKYALTKLLQDLSLLTEAVHSKSSLEKEAAPTP